MGLPRSALPDSQWISRNGRYTTQLWHQLPSHPVWHTLLWVASTKHFQNRSATSDKSIQTACVLYTPKQFATEITLEKLWIVVKRFTTKFVYTECQAKLLYGSPLLTSWFSPLKPWLLSSKYMDYRERKNNNRGNLWTARPKPTQMSQKLTPIVSWNIQSHLNR